ncbi:uncharacterized protein [Hyperolius riggenbachi]|uniref:uncharacterized protein n=1 Tax=Hyperolius riggenbachi TaxID=752182 RepID=UPI0035A2994D
MLPLPEVFREGTVLESPMLCSQRRERERGRAAHRFSGPLTAKLKRSRGGEREVHFVPVQAQDICRGPVVAPDSTSASITTSESSITTPAAKTVSSTTTTTPAVTTTLLTSTSTDTTTTTPPASSATSTPASTASSATATTTTQSTKSAVTSNSGGATSATASTTTGGQTNIAAADSSKLPFWGIIIIGVLAAAIFLGLLLGVAACLYFSMFRSSSIIGRFGRWTPSNQPSSRPEDLERGRIQRLNTQRPATQRHEQEMWVVQPQCGQTPN